jgi:hypothetical protein
LCNLYGYMSIKPKSRRTKKNEPLKSKIRHSRSNIALLTTTPIKTPLPHKQNLMKLFNKLLIDLNAIGTTTVDDLMVEFNKFTTMVIPYIIKHKNEIRVEKYIRELFLLHSTDELSFQQVMIQFITNCVLRGKISKYIHGHFMKLSLTPEQKQNAAKINLRAILNKIARIFYINHDIIDAKIISNYQSLIEPSFIQRFASLIHISYLTVEAEDIISTLPETDFTLCLSHLVACISQLSTTLNDTDYQLCVIIAGLLFYFETIYMC